MVDVRWVDSLRRLGAANARATRERLRALDQVEGLREFEQLCAEVDAAFGTPESPRTHPLGLVWYERRR